MGTYLFYTQVSENLTGGDLPADHLESQGCRLEVWRPGSLSAISHEASYIQNVIWWIFCFLGITDKNELSLYLVYKGDQLIHHTYVLPRFFRVPQMADQDIQMGNLWTSPDMRGQRIAEAVVGRITQDYKKEGRKFWYIVRDENVPSIRLAEKSGLICEGAGERNKRFGLSLFGGFVITSYRNQA